MTEGLDAVGLGPTPLPARIESSRRSPLVGRRAELEILERLWPEVEQGRRQVLFVGGEPGVGKTRLVAEAAGALFDIGVTVLVGDSSPDAGVSYQPFVEMLDHLFSAGAARGVGGGGGPGRTATGPPVGRGRPLHDALDEAPRSGGRPGGSCSTRWPGFSVPWQLTSRWRSLWRTCTGLSCPPWRCCSTWCRPARTRVCWCWRRFAPPRRTAPRRWPPVWPTCTGWRACAGLTWSVSTRMP